jgi:hypothetical protein
MQTGLASFPLLLGRAPIRRVALVCEHFQGVDM